MYIGFFDQEISSTTTTTHQQLSEQPPQQFQFPPQAPLQFPPQAPLQFPPQPPFQFQPWAPSQLQLQHQPNVTDADLQQRNENMNLASKDETGLKRTCTGCRTVSGILGRQTITLPHLMPGKAWCCSCCGSYWCPTCSRYPELFVHPQDQEGKRRAKLLSPDRPPTVFKHWSVYLTYASANTRSIKKYY